MQEPTPNETTNFMSHPHTLSFNLTDPYFKHLPRIMASNNDTNASFTASFFNNTDMGRRYRNAEVVTSPFGRDLIQKAGLLSPNLDNLTILDNACGTGVVSAALQDMVPPATKARMKLTMGDFSEPMLKVAKERSEAEGWVHTEGRIVDAQVRMNNTT